MRPEGISTAHLEKNDKEKRRENNGGAQNNLTFADGNIPVGFFLKKINMDGKNKAAIVLATVLMILNLHSCKPNEATPTAAESALDAGREFVRASLDGSYNRAAFYMLKDSVNDNLLNRWEETYMNLPRDDREKFRQANIIINKVENLSDSVSIINFSNSFKNTPQVLKVIRQKDSWVVDFKYTFSGNL
jgi:hypothetical protein